MVESAQVRERIRCVRAVQRAAERPHPQADDVGEKTIGQLCRDHGISVNTFYRWRRRYGGMGIPELRRQRHLEQENARLKRLLAGRDLEVDALRERLAREL